MIVARRPLRLAVVLCLAMLTGCVANVTGPARTTGTYTHKAAATAAEASSAVATAAEGATAGAEGNAMFPYLSILLADAEDALGAATTTFESIQPPTDEAVAIRDELTDLLDTASGDVSEARIAIRRGDAAPLAALADTLRADAEELSAFEEANR